MENLEKSIQLMALYDLYQPVLTEKQCLYFEDYYFNDYSLSEMSENYSVSRNAIFDLIKRTNQKLEDYEAKMHLYKISLKRKALIEKIRNEKNIDTLLQYVEDLEKVE